MAEEHTSKVAEELQNLTEDLKEVLNEEVLAGNAKVKAIRARVEEQLNDIRDKAKDTAREVVYRTKRAGRAVDEYAHEEPWRIVGAAVAVGVAIGFLLGRR